MIYIWSYRIVLQYLITYSVRQSHIPVCLLRAILGSVACGKYVPFTTHSRPFGQTYSHERHMVAAHLCDGQSLRRIFSIGLRESPLHLFGGRAGPTGDADGHIARLYGMIHPHASDTMTVRTVFIIDPAKKIRLTMNYPASTGRNFKEILRVIDSLQLTDSHKVATPANWEYGLDCVILPSITDPEVMKQLFPKGYRQLKPYLRLTPQPERSL